MDPLKSIILRTNKTGQNMPREVQDATSCNVNFKNFRTPLLPKGGKTPLGLTPIGPLALSSGLRPSRVPPTVYFPPPTLNVNENPVSLNFAMNMKCV